MKGKTQLEGQKGENKKGTWYTWVKQKWEAASMGEEKHGDLFAGENKNNVQCYIWMKMTVNPISLCIK